VVLDGEEDMQGYGRKPVAPLTRPRAGTWMALALFRLASWWGLYGAACWIAFRIVLAHARAGTHRFHLSALWALWALSGTTGLAMFDFSVVLFAACLLNAAAIAALMLLEPKPDRHGVNRSGIRRLLTRLADIDVSNRGRYLSSMWPGRDYAG
jgi:hypothetical protein